MNTRSLLDALASSENRKAVIVGTACGAGIVVGAVSLKLLAGAAIAAKVGVSLVAATSVGKVTYDRVAKADLTALVARFESEMSNLKGK